MAETALSQFPLGMEYLAKDEHAATYLALAAQLRTVNEQTTLESEAHRLGVVDVITQARAAGIPEGHLGRISVLALSMGYIEGDTQDTRV